MSQSTATLRRPPSISYSEKVQSAARSWTFLTNHAHVLIAISRNPELRQRDISELVGITEGAVQRILHELEEDGYVARERIGRRNRYSVLAGQPLRHPLEAGHTIEEIIDTVNRGTVAPS
jgi:DNA-binding MarR family transcriptional regulator